MTAKRKNPSPNDNNTSPMDATFRTIGMGIGMMSPRGPARLRNSASSTGGSRTWNTERMSSAGKPANSRLGTQMGM